MGYTNHQNTIQGLEGREKVQFEEKATRAGRLAGRVKGRISRGERKSLDNRARKWCSRVDENRTSRAEPGL